MLVRALRAGLGQLIVFADSLTARFIAFLEVRFAGVALAGSDGMTYLTRRLAMTLCVASVLAGCDSSLPPPPAGSKFSAETIATQETPPEQQFKGSLAGKPMHLLVNNCKVYKVDAAEGENVRWTLVLEGEPYPLPTYCIRQSLTADKGFVTAFIGRQALGAGGCCTGRPEYRSTDGLTWKPH